MLSGCKGCADLAILRLGGHPFQMKLLLLVLTSGAEHSIYAFPNGLCMADGWGVVMLGSELDESRLFFSTRKG